MDGNIIAGIVWDSREPLPLDLVQEFRPEIDHESSDGASEISLPDGKHGHVHRGRDCVLREPDRNILLPLSTSLTARVIDDAAQVTITQLFFNDSNAPIPRGSYTFPLPNGCTVIEFSCRVGRNKIIRAKVKPKQEAREDFDRASRNNQTAGLMEQDTPEIFTTTLGNIRPNTKLKAEISFVTFLKHMFRDRSSTATLTIPAYVASRYGRPPPGLTCPSSNGLLKGFSVHIEVVDPEGIQTITSKTHEIEVEGGVGRQEFENWEEFAAAVGTDDLPVSIVSFKRGPTFLDKDFVLDIATRPQDGLEAPHAWLETHPSLQNHKAIMLTLPPSLMLRNESLNEDGEILFVADRSGSMCDKIESLKSAMAFFLKGIPAGRKFNIWCFGTGQQYLWPRSQNYSNGTLHAALAFVKTRFRADMGGTELLRALRSIIKSRDPSRMTDIIILTDGEVWRLDDTINYVRDTRIATEARVRFFSLGVGSAVSHALVEGIAKAGGGYAEVIPAASKGGWEDRVVAVLKAALTGHVGPLRIEFDDDSQVGIPDEQFPKGPMFPTKPPFLQSPADISSLSPFLRNRVFMLFGPLTPTTPLSHINIRSTRPDGPEIVTRVAVKTLHRKEISIHKLGARAILGDLERGESWIHLSPYRPVRHSAEERRLERQEGEELGCKWSLVSKWTSFFAVEEMYEDCGDVHDEFMDVKEADEDLDLLRPWGVSGRWADGPNPALPSNDAEDPENDSNDDEDTPPVSDFAERRDDSSNDSDDEDWDDNGSGGGVAVSPNSTGQRNGQLRAPEGDQAPDPGTHHIEEQDGSSRQGSSSAGRSNQRPAGGQVSDFASTATAPATHEIVYRGPQIQAPPMNYPPGPQYQTGVNYSRAGPAPRLSSASRLVGSRVGRMSPFAMGGPRSPMFSQGLSHPDISGAQALFRRTKCDDSAEALPQQLPSVLPYPPHGLDATSLTFLQTDSIIVSNSSSISPQFQSASFSRALPPLGLSSTRQDKSKSLHSAPSHTTPLPIERERKPYMTNPDSGKTCEDVSMSSSSIDAESTERDLYFGFENAYERIRESSSMGRTSTSAVPSPYESMSVSTTITAPTFNIPASGALIYDSSGKFKISEDLKKEQIVRQLQSYQGFDGRFVCADSEIRALFGEEFSRIARDLSRQHPQFGYDLVLHMAIVAFLRLKFESCQALWTLLSAKTEQYINKSFLFRGIVEASRDRVLEDIKNRLHRVPVLIETPKTIEMSPTDSSGLISAEANVSGGLEQHRSPIILDRPRRSSSVFRSPSHSRDRPASPPGRARPSLGPPRRESPASRPRNRSPHYPTREGRKRRRNSISLSPSRNSADTRGREAVHVSQPYVSASYATYSPYSTSAYQSSSQSPINAYMSVPPISSEQPYFSTSQYPTYPSASSLYPQPSLSSPVYCQPPPITSYPPIASEPPSSSYTRATTPPTKSKETIQWPDYGYPRRDMPSKGPVYNYAKATSETPVAYGARSDAGAERVVLERAPFS
ncbi:uncharacterized protein Z518_10671 [Rhinocladiella mackenziei CBS 650.93]|uniref:Uncharacterized protein n=1 Tax=Rhinocladiella mackenziei CBS 650.93 TaxID=1442369 RepID=A0A0D2IB80_9EURO|nr:uncharacterized protein Z518_10671 [Rhinocladiella mackenziei CBS 650.93]KIX00531.1 hypothetical protein Z518_10671 [Rhinocladiella mackenziei CBS 650.93]